MPLHFITFYNVPLHHLQLTLMYVSVYRDIGRLLCLSSSISTDSLSCTISTTPQKLQQIVTEVAKKQYHEYRTNYLEKVCITPIPLKYSQKWK